MTFLKPRTDSEASASKSGRCASRLQRLRLFENAAAENASSAKEDAIKVAGSAGAQTAAAGEQTPLFVLHDDASYGSGSYGKVLRAHDASVGAPVAIKCVAPGRMRVGALESEVAILKTLSHPNIVAFRAWVPLASSDTTSAHVGTLSGAPLPEAVRGCHMVVMEACEGGELYEYVVNRGGLSEASAATIFQQLCSALSHAHSRGVTHRDIKLENILLARSASCSAPPLVKLIDWGLAHQHELTAEGSVVPKRLRSRCGSRSYMSPEVASRGATSSDPASREGYDGFAADVWSAGVCLFAMLFGFFPFDSADPAADWRAKRVMEAQRQGASTVATDRKSVV